MDFLAVISRPDFPSGSGPVGDYFGIRRLIDAHPAWQAAVIELNTSGTEVDWSPDGLRLRIDGRWFDMADIRTAIYVPICLEPEETVLRSSGPESLWPRFEAEQWRPISSLVEHRLDSMSGDRQCINKPGSVRTTNNKLMQHELLRRAGFDLPVTRMTTGFPRTGVLSDRSQLVTKNVSEGGWRSPTEFSPARIVERLDPGDGWPSIWQAPIQSAEELRVYVMGDQVTAVALQRDRDILDVRTVNEGHPTATIVDIPTGWSQTFVAMTRCLGLEYAVIDAIPAEGVVHVLEVNANGVWWFLPQTIGVVLEERFHRWLERIVERPAAT